MNDELLYRASLRVASAILTGVASALLIEIPLSGSNISNLTHNTLLCIVSTIAAIRIERELQE